MPHYTPRGGGGSAITTLLKFTAEGKIETTSGDLTIEPATGYISKFGAAFVTNHGLNTNQDVGINGKLEANGHIYGDNGASIAGSTFYSLAGAIFSTAWSQFTYGTIHEDNAVMAMGHDADANLVYRTNQTPDTLCVGLPTSSNNMVIARKGDFLLVDFANALATDPTLVIQAAGTTVARRMKAWHNKVDGVIKADTGGLLLTAPASAPTTVGASEYAVWIDEATNDLKVTVRYSNGTTTKTGTLCALT